MAEFNGNLKPGGPDSIEVKVCTDCTRTNLHGSLSKSHFVKGKKCPGEVRKVRYFKGGYQR